MTDLPDTHPLVMYSRGQISRQVAIDKPKIRDYAELLLALDDANLPMPMPSDEQIAAEVETFRMLMRTCPWMDSWLGLPISRSDMNISTASQSC